jgi:transcription termination/antitermination protein NusG
MRRVLAVSDDPNKTAEENLAATSDSSASADEARAADTNGHDGHASAEAPADVDNTSEVVPVEQKPLSRPALHGSEEEKAKKKAGEGPIEMDWYILKVQSNRERSIADALKRKIAIEGLDKYVDQIIVPTEKVTEFKAGKKKVVERKLYPGYIVVHMAINDDTWFAVRETSGIGDFTGAGGKPSPMLAHEVARIIQTEEEVSDEAPKLDIKFNTGDRVKVKDGTFEGFEGEVGTIDAQSGKIQVMINIFGRSTPVELEYWQVENV